MVAAGPAALAAVRAAALRAAAAVYGRRRQARQRAPSGLSCASQRRPGCAWARPSDWTGRRGPGDGCHHPQHQVRPGPAGPGAPDRYQRAGRLRPAARPTVPASVLGVPGRGRPGGCCVIEDAVGIWAWTGDLCQDAGHLRGKVTASVGLGNKGASHADLPADYVVLDGSERHPSPGAAVTGPADPGETFTVSIVLRRRPGGPPVPELLALRAHAAHLQRRRSLPRGLRGQVRRRR